MDAEIMQTMMVEISRGLTPGQSSMAPLSQEERTVWEALEAEMIQIEASGRVVDYEYEWPDVSDYTPGRAERLNGRRGGS